ncbi:hypothetical protein [Pseudobacter ginsenosidimutans]|uniref:DUF4397 domain-containing protein n=1 Tax=Pseudobacter ginsenosidimutans TaxID=661488 RepID=A0A4Q7MQK8_9BACT|nr:hypothetical protein [Pseudobacter ginsenosidimutans]QEC42143.1 hypothetical protein FSB84_10750 [Pseudobacter ginsenosidimutans]RZS71016.1 hypothetical protein EV199_2916 [Pseudobacter ginsenosidimutans]
MLQLKNKKYFTIGFLKSLLLTGSVLLTFSACKKVLKEEIFPASLTVVNAINDNTSFIRAYFGETNPKIYDRLPSIDNGKSWDYATNKTDQPLTVFLNNDTLNKDEPLIKTRLSLESAGIYTHFIYGSPTQVKEKTTKDDLPRRSQQDSSAQLRIINLYESRAIDVVQLEPAGGTIVSDLKYEQLSAFIRVPIDRNFQEFRFQIKDHETGSTLAILIDVNMNWDGALNSNWLFKARTMVVNGKWTGTGNSSAKVTTIGHF